MTDPRSIVFCFSGQGSQYRHMGRELYEAEPVFRDRLDDLDRLAAEAVGESVVGRMFDPARRKTDSFDDVAITNPAILMVELGLLALLRSRNIHPDAVLGASLGEYAAAVAAGILPAETAMRLVGALAGAVSTDLPGGMLAILESADLHARDPVLRARTEIAGINGPRHFVVSGTDEALSAAEAALTEREVLHQRVAVRHAFHSSFMDPMRPRYLEQFAGVAMDRPRLPVYSCATKGRVETVDAGHFWKAVRQPIDVSATMQSVEAEGPHLYLDLGPSGVLYNHMRSNFAPGSGSQSLPVLSPFADGRKLLGRVETRCADLGLNRQLASSMETPMKVYGFPGQGSQVKGMGSDLFERYPEQVAQADAILGYSIERLCRDDPDGRLRQTEFTQPALYVVEALAYLARRDEGAPDPSFLIGHSLGEYVALFAAGAFDFATGLDLVRQRAELMSRADAGGMAAVIGGDIAMVRDVLQSNGLTDLDVAGHNSHNQVVLAGALDDLDRARPLFEAQNAGFFPLNVSAAFHSRYMKEAGEAFRQILDRTAFGPLRFPVISNVTARPHRADAIGETLAQQITRTVQWVDTIRYVMAHGDFDFEEVGPGTVLTRAVAAIRKAVPPLDLSNETGAGAPEPEPEPAPEPEHAPEPEPEPAPVVALAPAAAATPEPGPLGNGDARAHVSPQPERSPEPAPAAAASRAGGEAAGFGAESFRRRYGLRHACLAGSLYGGISGRDMLVRLARGGRMMGFFGAGGLSLAEVERALRGIRDELGPDAAVGANLCYEGHPSRERQLVDLYLRLGIDVVEVSGFPRVSPAIVKFRLKGGRVVAKVSTLDMARAFLAPPPEDVVRKLVETGDVTAQEAERAAALPVASDLCVEGEGGWIWSSAGLMPMLPEVLRLRDRCRRDGERVHVGAAGGIGTPAAVEAVRAMGAEFVLVGSVNQCTVEAATSTAVKDMLQAMSVNDVDIAPFEPLFEFGVRARMLKKGVFFPARATRLYDLWREYADYDAIPADVRRSVENSILPGGFDGALRAGQARNGESDSPRASDTTAKGQLAKAFASYLDEGFERARAGDAGQRVNFAIYTGPALGAFNRLVQGTSLEHWQARHVDEVMELLIDPGARPGAVRVAS